MELELQPVLLAAGLGLAFVLLALKRLRKGSGDKQKQGGYGKSRPTASRSSVIRPHEFYAPLGYLFAGKGSTATLCPAALRCRRTSRQGRRHPRQAAQEGVAIAVRHRRPAQQRGGRRCACRSARFTCAARAGHGGGRHGPRALRALQGEETSVAGEGMLPLLGKETACRSSSGLAPVTRLDSPAGDAKLHGIGEGAEESCSQLPPFVG